MARPVTTKARAIWSTQVPDRTAAAVPSRSAIVMAMPRAATISSRVATSFGLIRSRTWSLLLTEMPRSPVTALRNQIDVLDRNRLVEAQLLPQRGDALGITGTTRPKLLLNGISRRQTDQDEDQRRGQEHHGHEL